MCPGINVTFDDLRYAYPPLDTVTSPSNRYLPFAVPVDTLAGAKPSVVQSVRSPVSNDGFLIETEEPSASMPSDTCVIVLDRLSTRCDTCEAVFTASSASDATSSTLVSIPSTDTSSELTLLSALEAFCDAAVAVALILSVVCLNSVFDVYLPSKSSGAGDQAVALLPFSNLTLRIRKRNLPTDLVPN